MLKGFGRKYNWDSLADLTAAVERLGDQRVARLFRSFGEERAAIARIVVLALILIWVWYWCFGSVPILVADAWSVLPWSIGILIASTFWLIAIKFRVVPTGPKTDSVGLAANLVFVTIFVHKAFYLLISVNALLPFCSIAVAVRFGNRAFYACLVLTLVILFSAGPPGYWIGRPPYAIYAVTLTIALPMLIVQILNALRHATFHFIRARDAQTRFIGTVSHEFRTPLNSLTNCALLINPKNLPPDDQTLLRAVSYNAQALLHRVNNVLDIAAIDGGQLQLQPEPFQVRELAHAVYAVCNTQAKENIQFAIDITNEADIAVVGDAGRIEQALTNIVSNALKFTTDGTVMLTVKRLQSTVPDVATLQFAVIDTGIGIPKDKQTEIFEPFRQLAQGLERAYGGVGLGLYVVRSISDLMNGELRVDDNPGGGTIFTWVLRLPTAQDQAHTASTSILDALATHRRTFQPLHCIVFEDMPSNQLIIGRMLELAGHTVTFHDRGEDAWMKIEQARADLVFLDLHMPGVSGLDVLHDIAQKRDKTCAPAVVVVTADATTSAARFSRAAGVSEYLTKPLSPTKLLHTIERLHPTIKRDHAITSASWQRPSQATT